MSVRETTRPTERTTIEHHIEREDRDAELSGIRDGLLRSPRSVSARYLYDERGSRLFEEICRLPEYYPTRTERAILGDVAGKVASLTGAEELVELGSGAATKTPLLLDAMEKEGRLRLYVPFDVSESTVHEVADAFAERYSELRIHGVVGDFLSHLEHVPNGRHRLVAFLGGTLGNLLPDQAVRFLQGLGEEMNSGEHLLLGTDLVKDVRVLEAAYNDSAGVTAEFNRNALRVLNGLVGSDFDPESFEHRAFFNVEHSRIEMRLRSRDHQVVSLPAIDLEIALTPGDEILTEVSKKYDRPGVEALLDRSGFDLVEWFTDRDGLFALSLARKRPGTA